MRAGSRRSGVYLKDNDISPLDGEPSQLTADCIPSEVASHSRYLRRTRIDVCLRNGKITSAPGMSAWLIHGYKSACLRADAAGS